jgi:hypothetical protein
VSDELKPCPFCGSNAHLQGDHKAVKVQCANEECEAEVGCWYSKTDAGRAKATAVWNTRVPDRQIVEQRDALREALAMAENAVQAHLDMVNVIQKWNALPIPAILETAQHNCPIVLEQVRAALAKLEPQP